MLTSWLCVVNTTFNRDDVILTKTLLSVESFCLKISVLTLLHLPFQQVEIFWYLLLVRSLRVN